MKAMIGCYGQQWPFLLDRFHKSALVLYFCSFIEKKYETNRALDLVHILFLSSFIRRKKPQTYTLNGSCYPCHLVASITHRLLWHPFNRCIIWRIHLTGAICPCMASIAHWLFWHPCNEYIMKRYGKRLMYTLNGGRTEAPIDYYGICVMDTFYYRIPYIELCILLCYTTVYQPEEDFFLAPSAFLAYTLSVDGKTWCEHGRTILGRFLWLINIPAPSFWVVVCSFQNRRDIFKPPSGLPWLIHDYR